MKPLPMKTYEFVACNKDGVMLAQGFWKHNGKGDVRRVIARNYRTTYGKVSASPCKPKEEIFLSGSTR